MSRLIKNITKAALLFSLLISNCTFAQVHVDGYYRNDGTYVEPHYRSNPDGNPYNNWSYPGNTNPYTGKIAPGNPETYLKNYYKIYNNYSTSTYKNYNLILLETTFTDLKKGYDYTVTSKAGMISGKVKYIHENIWKLYNIDGKHVGYVERHSKYRYKVYDIEGGFVHGSKVNSAIGTIFGWFFLIGASFGIASLAL
jgi:hypothetical protein